MLPGEEMNFPGQAKPVETVATGGVELFKVLRPQVLGDVDQRQGLVDGRGDLGHGQTK
jgi:hypothetical protein